VFDERLTEIRAGEFEGTEETVEAVKLFWQAINNGDKGTENFEAFIKRNCDLCDVITKEHQGKNVLIVTHALNSRIIDYYFRGKPKDYDFLGRVIDKGELITYEN